MPRTAGSHVLIVRAWFEPANADEGLRVRVLEPDCPDSPERLVLTTRSRESACEAVCTWLRALSSERP